MGALAKGQGRGLRKRGGEPWKAGNPCAATAHEELGAVPASLGKLAGRLPLAPPGLSAGEGLHRGAASRPARQEGRPQFHREEQALTAQRKRGHRQALARREANPVCQPGVGPRGSARCCTERRQPCMLRR